MSERKVKVNGSLQAFSFDKTKKYKYNSSGNLVEATTIADNDIVFSGSKSSLRRIADLERNVSVLATQLTTTDGDTLSDTGRVASADKWTTARTLSLTGDASGSVSINGSSNVSLSVTVADDSHNHTIANVDGLQTALDAAFKGVTVSNDTLTFTKGDGTTVAVTTSDANTNYYVTGGSFDTATQVLTLTRNSGSATVDLSGLVTSAELSTAISNLVNGANASFDTLKEIQDAMATDAELASAISSLTIGGGTLTVAAGAGLSGSGTFGANATGNSTITISHADTSSATNLAASGRRYVTGLTFDAFGHVTGYTTGTETVVDTNTTYSAGNGLSLTGTTFAMSGSFTGSFTATGDITAYSDDRLKTNVETIGGALDKVSRVRGVNFTRKEDGSRSTGVVAQELAAVLPEAVKTDDNGMHHVAYGNITGLLIEAIKELKDEIDYLKGLK